MEDPAERPSIEFIDVGPAEAPVPDDPRHERNRRAVGLVGAGVVLSACLLFASAVSGRDDQDPTSNEPTPTTGSSAVDEAPRSTTTTSLVQELASVQFAPWPDPPEDFAPTVIGRPGPDVSLLDDITETAVVYVNTLGRPTVIDLDTGWIEQVEVAPARSYEYFGVEFGRVVSFDGRNRNVREATDRSLLFHAHRADSLVEAEDFRSSTSPAPHLCLTAEACAFEWWTFDRSTNGTDTIRRANPTDDPFVYEMLFGETWTDQRGTRLPPDGFGIDIRVPAPLHAEAWIVHQPGSEAWRLMTRVN